MKCKTAALSTVLAITSCSYMQISSAGSYKSPADIKEQPGNNKKADNFAKPAAGNLKKDYSEYTRETSPHGLPERSLIFSLHKGRIDQLRTNLASVPPQPGDKPERLMWEATCLSQEKRYEQAVNLFNQTNLNDAPDLVLLKAARAYEEEQKFDKAISTASRVLKHGPDKEAYKIRTQCYVMQKNLEQAINDYLALADLDQRSERYYLARAGNLMVEKQQYDRALTLMDRAQKAPRGDKSVSIVLVKANCYKGKHNYPEALKLLNSAIELATTNHESTDKEFTLPLCYTERAKCYEQLGKPQLALADREKVKTMSRGIESDLMGK